MAVTNIFSANTKAKASEVNSDFVYVDYAAIANGKKIQWYNAAGTLDHYINEDTNDNLIFRLGTANKQMQFVNLAGISLLTIEDSGDIVATQNGAVLRVAETSNIKYLEISNNGTDGIISTSSGSILLNPTSGVVSLQKPSVRNYIRIYDSANTKYAELSQDGTYSTLTDVGGSGVFIDPGTDGDKIILARHPRNNNGSATYPNSHIQSGWGYIVGDGTTQISGSVTFPIAYSSDNIRVILSGAGARGTISGAPVDEGDGTLNPGQIMSVYSEDITTTGFTIHIVSDSATNLVISNNYFFHWIAIGPV